MSVESGGGDPKSETAVITAENTAATVKATVKFAGGHGGVGEVLNGNAGRIRIDGREGSSEERENWDEAGDRYSLGDGLGVKDPHGNRDGNGVWLGGSCYRESWAEHDRESQNHKVDDYQMDGGQSSPLDPTGTELSNGEAQHTMSPPVHHVNPLGVHLISHPERGRGVFTSTSIPANTLIEESPVLVLSKEEWENGNMDGTILGSYAFCWSGGGMGLGLGLASLFNHSSTPNVNFIRSPSTGTIIFRTSRSIQSGEELCICYSADESKLWFTPAGHPQPSTSTLKGNLSPTLSDHQLPIFDNWFEDPDVPEEGLLPVIESAAERTRRKEIERMELKAEQTQKWKRKQKALDKCRAESAEIPPSTGNLILAPRPVPYNDTSTEVVPSSTSSTPVSDGSTNLSNNTSLSSTSRPFDIPTYPCLPDTVELPVPLHSDKKKKRGTRHAHQGPVVLTEDLDWREEDWSTSLSASTSSLKSLDGPSSSGTATPLDASVMGDSWAEVERLKGPAEIEEDAELVDEGWLDIWAVDVKDPKMTRVVLNFVKEEMNVLDPRLRHLKRVARRPKIDPTSPYDQNLIALCAHTEMTYSTLTSLLVKYSPLLSDLQPILYKVPSTPARTLDQLRARSLIWPVLFSPLPAKPTDGRTWSPARRAWVRAGIQRVLNDALKAKESGEVGCSVYCTSAPELLWPSGDHFIPPTIGLRASSHDTRISEKHPLRHSTLNCIASIANLRTVPPFSEMIPTRNGADYLLTSLSLFISHEPCVMCSMALLHSRVREVFFVFPRSKGGGFTGNGKRTEGFGIHGHGSLNHRFEVWRWTGDLDDGVEERLRIDEGLNL